MKMLIGIGILAVMGCGGAGTTGMTEATPEQIQNSTAALQRPEAVQLVGASNDFGMRLLARLSDGESNVFISPVSVSTALAMAYNGAAGQTKVELAKVLGWQGMELATVNNANANLLRVLQHADPKVASWVANSVWVEKSFPVESSFLQRCEQSYSATVKNLDFASPAALGEINAWVSEKTNEKIPKIIDKIPGDARMYLINATYFNGKWKEPFKKGATQDGVFHAPSGDVTVPMMAQNASFSHAQGGGFRALSMPYGDGKRMSMLIILPDKGKDWRTLDKKAFSPQLGGGQCIVRVPRFKIEYETLLNEPLAAMGMPTIFDPNKADLSGISKADRLFVTRVIHKTFVDVNEEGTEAAAVTGIEAGVTSAPAQPFEFIVDRPFVFLIRDEVTGAVLFAGAIVNPKG